MKRRRRVGGREVAQCSFCVEDKDEEDKEDEEDEEEGRG